MLDHAAQTSTEEKSLWTAMCFTVLLGVSRAHQSLWSLWREMVYFSMHLFAVVSVPARARSLSPSSKPTSTMFRMLIEQCMFYTELKWHMEATRSTARHGSRCMQ